MNPDSVAMEQDLSALRREYSKAKLNVSRVASDPCEQFRKWMQESLESDVPEPTAMVLSTASKDGVPSSRVVLLKGVENNQFLFYTNYDSRKGQELSVNKRAALTFFWPEMERQINIRGLVERTSEAKSDEYFASRPWKARVGAWASKQSEQLTSRGQLVKTFLRLAAKYAGKKVPRPPHWGGFALTPLEIEFWQGRPSRLHDRILYQKTPEGQWQINRLSP